MRFLALFLVCLQAQEPPKRTREEIIKDLEAKFLASGPISAKLEIGRRLKSGEIETCGRGTLYLALKERRVYFEYNEIEEGKESPKKFLYQEGAAIRLWGGDGAPTLVDLDRLFQTLADPADAWSDTLSGITGKRKEMFGWLTRGHPGFRLDLQSGGDSTSLRVSLGRSEKSAYISWLDALKAEPQGKVAEIEGGYEFQLPVGGATISVDSSTGFLRRLDLYPAGGVARFLNLSGIRTPADPPSPAFPKRFSIPIQDSGEVIRTMKSGVMVMATGALGHVLETLDANSIAGKSPELQALLVSIVEKACKAVVEAFLAGTVDRALADYEKKGGTVEAMEERVDEFAKVIEEEFRKKEASRAEAVQTLVGWFHSELAKCVEGNDKGAAESKAALKELIDQAFKNPGDARFNPKPPAARVLVRRGIQRLKDSK